MKINPEEIKFHIKEHYGKSGSWREGFKSSKNDSLISKTINFLKRHQLRLVENNFTNLNGKKILDAACGNGEYSLALAKKFPLATIYAIDFSKAMCEQTKARVKKQGITNIVVAEGDIEKLEFEDYFFDVVLCIDTLHHIPNSSINKGLRELSRVIKKGGSLVVDFKNKNNPFLYYQHKKKNRVTYYRTNRTLKIMNSFLRKEGVKVIQVKGSGGPYFVAPYVTLFCEKK